MLAEELRHLASEALDIGLERLSENVSFTKDLGVDSLSLYHLVHLIETKYDVEIDSRHLDLLDNLALARRYVESLIAGDRPIAK
jgi:acyl carrier protein